MKQVADRAGVAVSSVSRVLNGHPDVSAVMRNRVLDSVAALGYEPDLLAQSLRKGATMTVGYLVGDISNPLLAEIVLGAELQLREAGYSSLLTNSVNDPGQDVDHLRLLQQRRVDGVLLSLTDEDDPALLSALDRVSVPTVLVDRRAAGRGLAAVLSDHAYGIRAAVAHVADLGHQRIALVNGNPRVRPSRERAAALRSSCRARGVTATVRSAAFSPQHGEAATLELMQVDEAPTVIIAGSNQILVGVLRALRTLGLSVPHDVSLITCDDVALSEFLQPAIATISRDPHEIGRIGAELLLEQLRGEAPRQQLLPTGFRPTGSCARPPTGQRAPRAPHVVDDRTEPS